MKYGKTVKEQAVLRILNGDSTIKKISEELDVHYTTVEIGCVNIRSKVRKKYKATTDSKHNLPVAENILNHNFEAEDRNMKWVSLISGPKKGGFIWRVFWTCAMVQSLVDRWVAEGQ
jgi:hypothetical protein